MLRRSESGCSFTTFSSIQTDNWILYLPISPKNTSGREHQVPQWSGQTVSCWSAQLDKKWWEKNKRSCFSRCSVLNPLKVTEARGLWKERCSSEYPMEVESSCLTEVATRQKLKNLCSCEAAQNHVLLVTFLQRFLKRTWTSKRRKVNTTDCTQQVIF